VRAGLPDLSAKCRAIEYLSEVGRNLLLWGRNSRWKVFD